MDPRFHKKFLGISNRRRQWQCADWEEAAAADLHSLEVDEDIFVSALLQKQAASSHRHLVVDVVEADGGAVLACRLKTHSVPICVISTDMSLHECQSYLPTGGCPHFNSGDHLFLWHLDPEWTEKKHLKDRKRQQQTHRDPSNPSSEEFHCSPAKLETRRESSCRRTVACSSGLLRLAYVCVRVCQRVPVSELFAQCVHVHVCTVRAPHFMKAAR